jgi:molybdopterin-guanine dinucleotide biosynthesis protein A
MTASAIILAGGRSARMGTPKALLPFPDAPLVLHVARGLQPLFAELVVVGAPGQSLPALGGAVVHDPVAHQGPVAGILHGLRACTREYAFVTSCDAAFLSPSLIGHLLALGSGYDAVVPRWAGRLQPLVAVYQRQVMPVLEAQLAVGQLKLVGLLEHLNVRYVDEEEIRQFDPAGASFFNINTPADYQEALRRFRAGYT